MEEEVEEPEADGVALGVEPASGGLLLAGEQKTEGRGGEEELYVPCF